MQHRERKRKLAAVERETQEHPRNGQSRNTSVPRINEEYITQVSESIEGSVAENCPKNSAGESMTSLKLSTVRIEVGSY